MTGYIRYSLSCQLFYQRFVKDDYNKNQSFFAFFTQDEESLHHVFVIYNLFERIIQCSLCGCLWDKMWNLFIEISGPLSLQEMVFLFNSDWQRIIFTDFDSPFYFLFWMLTPSVFSESTWGLAWLGCLISCLWPSNWLWSQLGGGGWREIYGFSFGSGWSGWTI